MVLKLLGVILNQYTVRDCVNSGLGKSCQEEY